VHLPAEISFRRRYKKRIILLHLCSYCVDLGSGPLIFLGPWERISLASRRGDSFPVKIATNSIDFAFNIRVGTINVALLGQQISMKEFSLGAFLFEEVRCRFISFGYKSQQRTMSSLFLALWQFFGTRNVKLYIWCM